MPRLALLFPGQGVQVVGMGQELLGVYPEAASFFQRADQALGFQLSQLIANGPKEQLDLTPFTQPAILTTSLAYWKAFAQEGVDAEAAIGLSLGEYSALVAAGALEFDQAVSLVHARGKAMDACYPAGKGAVVVVLGLQREAVEAICSEIATPEAWVQASNFNGPGQVVIAGEAAGVELAMERLQQAGAKRLVKLPVSAPFHTKLLEPAGEAFAPYLKQVKWNQPGFEVVSNVTARSYQSVSQIEGLLLEQVSRPIEFERGVQYLLAQGYRHFLEVGPGSTLGSLVKKIDRQAVIYQASSVTDIAGVAARIKAELGE